MLFVDLDISFIMTPHLAVHRAVGFRARDQSGFLPEVRITIERREKIGRRREDYNHGRVSHEMEDVENICRLGSMFEVHT